MGEGLFGNLESMAGTPHAFETLGGAGGNHPSSTLYFSRDPVALDCVMYDDLLDEFKAEGNAMSGHNKGFLEYAADNDHNLGTYEMKDTTGNNSYEDIDFKDV